MTDSLRSEINKQRDDMKDVAVDVAKHDVRLSVLENSYIEILAALKELPSSIAEAVQKNADRDKVTSDKVDKIMKIIWIIGGILVGLSFTTDVGKSIIKIIT